MDTSIGVIAAILAFLLFIVPARDLILNKDKKGWKKITSMGRVLLTLGILGLVVTLIAVFRSRDEKDREEAKSTNVGILEPNDTKGNTIVWNLGGQPFYFNSNDIDIERIVLKDTKTSMIPFDGIDFKARLEDHKIKVSTTIRDSAGNVICQMNDNEWIVNRPQFAFDRNFNDTSLEVKNNLGEIVFQIEISGNNMFMNAKFVKPDGQLVIAFPIMRATPTVPGFNGIANFESGHYKWASQYKFCQFKPMFKYTSALHPKERLPNVVDTFSGTRFENIPPYPKDVKDSSKNYLILQPYF